MEILNDVIELMNKEEIRAFKIFTQRTNNDPDRKDVELFNYIRKSGDKYDEEEILNALYNDESRNTFHRLKSRLQTEVNKSLILLNIDKNKLIRLYHSMAIVEFYLAKNSLELSLHYLKKAERLAKSLHRYDVLDIIYHEFIRLSQNNVLINPEEYIRKRKENYKVLEQLREFDDILATVNYRLRITQNYGNNETSVRAILEKTVEEFSKSGEVNNNPELKFRLFEAVSRILLDKRDYRSLETYLLNTYDEFEKEKLFNKSSHNIKLQFLSYIVNTLFKNGKYDESLAFAEKLKMAMDEYDRSHYAKFLFFYYNSLVINYFKKDLDKSIQILEEMRTIPEIRNTPFYNLFVYMNLAITWYKKEDYNKSIKNLVQIYILDGFRIAAPGLKLKIGVAELIIRYQLQDGDVLINRIGQLKKDFSDLLKTSDFFREKNLIQLLGRMIESPNVRSDKNILRKAKTFIKNTDGEMADDEIISYNDFILEACGIDKKY